MRLTRLVLLVALLPVATAAAQAADPGSAAQRELAALYEADQADRHIDPAQFSRLSPAEQERLDREQQAKDAARRTRAVELVKQGAARSADDYYHAAVIMQHGRSASDSLQAHEWAEAALGLDATHAQALYLFAASWDRYQIGLGQPQWYGTSVDRRPDGSAELHEIDDTKVSDAERKRYTGWTLAERRAWVETLNQRQRSESQ